MPLTSLWQFLLPDSLLLEIFTYLGIRDLGHAAQVCTLWRRVAYDELLWQWVARTRWKITGPICPGRQSWRSEVKRLVHHTPFIQSEIFTEAHSDEVLDVSISHRGDYFCTTSKDSCVILWKLDFPSIQVGKANTHELWKWSLTQYSKFNSDDSLLLVCGVQIPDDSQYFPDTHYGRGAIFTVPDLTPIQFVNLDPPTLFGAWLTPDIFVGGNLQGLHGAIKIEAHKVPDVLDCDSDTRHEIPEEMFYFRGNKHHQMSILVADVSYDCQNQEFCDTAGSCQTDESACTSASGLPSNLPNNQRSNPCSMISTDEKCDITKMQVNLIKGGGDSNTDSRLLKKMKLECKEEASSSAVSNQDTKSVNPNIEDLENSASFWDRVNTVVSSDVSHWRSNPQVSNSSESECSTVTPGRNFYQNSDGCYGYRSDITEDGSGSSISGFLSNSTEASDLVVCKKTRLEVEEKANENLTSSGMSNVSLCDKLRISSSDSTISSQDFLTNSGSVSITGLSSSSDIYSVPSSNTLQNEDFTSSNSENLSSADGTYGSSGNPTTNSNFSGDQFYNTELHTNISSCTLVRKDSSEEEINSLAKSRFSSMSRSCSNRQGSFKKYICFVSGAHDAVLVQEVTVDKLESLEDIFASKDRHVNVTGGNNREFDKKDHYFFIKDCYITGMCLSQDHRYVYFNYREWDRKEGEESDDDSEPDDPLRDVHDRSFCENLKVGVIDLVTMTRLENLTYEGHIGFSSYPAWYICLAASDDYLGSGSEDARAYLWDRHYCINLAELNHSELVVNGIAFSPVDQECCVTVCDDKSIIVWRSRNRMAELTNC